MEESQQIKKTRAYFAAWLKQDKTVIPRVFAEGIVYTECTGTVYAGKAQCVRWFSEWNKDGRVLAWDILKTHEVQNVIIVEWFFKCEYEKNTDSFNGVSVIEFNSHGLIASISEYCAKADLAYPYGKPNL